MQTAIFLSAVPAERARFYLHYDLLLALVSYQKASMSHSSTQCSHSVQPHGSEQPWGRRVLCVGPVYTTVDTAFSTSRELTTISKCCTSRRCSDEPQNHSHGKNSLGWQQFRERDRKYRHTMFLFVFCLFQGRVLETNKDVSINERRRGKQQWKHTWGGPKRPFKELKVLLPLSEHPRLQSA